QRGSANSSILISRALRMGLGILLRGVVPHNIGFVEAFHMTAFMQAGGALLFIIFTRSFFERRKLNEN
ncbi:MAG: MFS transporter, partial [Muribaculaceae bacterium]|nr:MFS transporter [Muribaculaceae bacterium]